MALETAYSTELKSVSRNAGITAVGLVVLNVLSFVNNAIITRTLGADQYGIYVLATRVLEFAIAAASLGLAHSLIRFVSMYAGKQNQGMIRGTITYVLKISAISALIFFAILFSLSNFISIQFFNRPELSFYLRLILIALPFTVLLNAFLNTFIGLKQIKYQVLFAYILSPLFFFALIVTVFWSGYSINGLIIVHIINLVVMALAAWFVLKRSYFNKVKKVLSGVEIHKLWEYNIPIYAGIFANTAFRLSPIFIMGYFLENAEIGVFNVSYKVGALVLFSMSAFQTIFMPTISALFAKNDKQTISDLFKTVTKWIFTFSLIFFFIILAYEEPILKIFGEEFTSGTVVLILIMGGELVNASTGLVGAIILMSGRSGVMLVNSLIQFVMIVALAWWLTPIYGSVGTAIAYAFSITIMNFVRIVELYHFEKMHPYKFSTLKPMLASSVAFLVIFYLNRLTTFNIYLEFVLGILIFLFVFIVILLWVKLDEDDLFILNLIRMQFKRKPENSS